nr:MAG TPA: hypothetical protein [Caudoviricetes sp.]DAI59872.1 MAG TPA: hypothetical protein [Caudoviricetes sp.]DAL63486.1 MAG TPA_asm: hypothetical protein [Caudoviricetes sp.]DAO96883.1 MAG TPA: hypothetical protein [Caudoviricetes sp.]DAP24992.1 MAG TPA: hypothetical protein [Caudoviricetes sp.]
MGKRGITASLLLCPKVGTNPCLTCLIIMI